MSYVFQVRYIQIREDEGKVVSRYGVVDDEFKAAKTAHVSTILDPLRITEARSDVEGMS